jgi:hypothetical protein
MEHPSVVITAELAEHDRPGLVAPGGWISVTETGLFEPVREGLEARERQVLLTDHKALSALYRITASAAAVDALVGYFSTWEELALSSPYTRGAHLGAWAAALRFPAVCPAMGPPGSGVRVLSLYDEGDYPVALSAMAFPPPLLYLRGAVPRGAMIAVGGVHRPSAEGVLRARVAARVCALLGLAVVASLDTGCGRAALEESVRAHNPALGVAGASLETVGPNDWLVENLVSGGGGVLSAYPPGTSWSEMGCIFGSELVAVMGHLVVVVEFGLHLSGGLAMVQATMRGSRPLISFGWRRGETPLGVSSMLTRGGRLVDTFGRVDLPPELACSERAVLRAKAGLPLADAVVADAISLERAMRVLALT